MPPTEQRLDVSRFGVRRPISRPARVGHGHGGPHTVARRPVRSARADRYRLRDRVGAASHASTIAQPTSIPDGAVIDGNPAGVATTAMTSGLLRPGPETVATPQRVQEFRDSHGTVAFRRLQTKAMRAG